MKVEIRNNSARICGYVNVVGRESRVLHDATGEFVEIVKPHTFQHALEKNEIGLMFNHKRQLEPITMELHEDAIGLYADIVLNDSEIIEKAKNQELQGWSFGFYNPRDEWTTRQEDGMRIRKISDLTLEEISILDCTPAYIATSIEVRDGQESLKEYRQSQEPVTVQEQTEKPTLADIADSVADAPPDMSGFQTLKKKYEYYKTKTAIN
ncbi:HK97 family phage prohead protease [Anaerovibrio sp. JC8]|uniref:HK97 family phage prohead protease n=1 Tax=Anaerovibrio sp. JC8 TaxID=1240085 RepID=UPI000A100165|nr:HK97 family phage prohead protease [Anaerovibrio sp. JC8]